MEPIKLMYIIPAHVLGKTEAAITSIIESTVRAKVVVVGPDDVTKQLSTRFGEAQLVHFKQAGADTSYQALVNLGIEHAKTDSDIEWVSILESDDTLLPEATGLFENYRKVYDDVDMFTGLALVVNGKTDDGVPQLTNFANEAAWAGGIMEAPGIYDFNAMLRMNFILLNASYIKLSLFDEIGLLKPNLKYYYDYEFVLRVVYNGFVVRSIPRATHYHTNDGEALIAHRDLPTDAREFWAGAARKEYFYEFDREVSYEPTPVEDESQ